MIHSHLQYPGRSKPTGLRNTGLGSPLHLSPFPLHCMGKHGAASLCLWLTPVTCLWRCVSEKSNGRGSEEGVELEGRRVPSLVSTAAVPHHKEARHSWVCPCFPGPGCSSQCRITLQEPGVQGSTSLQLFRFFSAQLGFHSLLVFKLFLEELGGGWGSKRALWQFPFGGQRAILLGSVVVGRRT